MSALHFSKACKVFHIFNSITYFFHPKNQKILPTQTTPYSPIPKIRVPIRNTADYSPFGVQLDGRKQQVNFYRRGFNGMEKDDEVKGLGNQYTTEFRQLDPRIGRWLSLDPLAHQYTSISPYTFVANNPIIYIDGDGRKITNADKERLEKAKSELNDITEARNSLSTQYGSLTNKKEFNGTNEQWKRVKKSNKSYDVANEKVKELEIAVMKTDELIEEFKKNSPILFEYIDKIQNEAKENVDFYVGTKNLFDSDNSSGEYKGGFNTVPEFATTDGIVRPVSQEFGVNKIAVTIENDKEDRHFFEINFHQNIINHEAGHFSYMVENSKKYSEYLQQLKKDGRSINGGHNTDDESGKKAENFGKIKDLKANED